MLSEIYIENIAVIEKVNVSFNKGFNVFTGETGAGKSIIIDAINAVLGQRTSKELIRTGAEKAVVSAVFTDLSDENIKSLEELGFSVDEDGLLILHRELFLSGKNICKVNGVPVNVGTLRELSKILITIQGQHETYELMSPDLHIQYIDFAGHLNDKLSEYREVYRRFKEAEKKLSKNNESESDRLRQIDILRYQIDELTDANLKEGETETLEARKKVLLSSGKIKECLFSAKNALGGDDDFIGAVSLLKEAFYALNDASQYQDELSPIAKRLGEAYYELDDIYLEISNRDDFSTDIEQESELIEERLDLIYRLGRKYGHNISDMLKTLDQSQKELSYLESYEYNMEQLEKEYNKQKEIAVSLAESLSKERKKVAKRLVEDIKAQLIFLDMPNVDLCFNIEKVQLNDNGCDKIEMLISPNAGEALKPVSKIASGGELSRIMLAIKNVLSKGERVGAMIFDEIDTGISGSAAQKVGLKLKETSGDKQIICITHQTQIAALANSHYLIEKQVINDRSYTKVTELDFDMRVRELARIMGGANVSELTLKHAEEMLKNAENI